MELIVDFLGYLKEQLFTWLPLIFFGLLVYFFWRMLAFMPRVKPTEVEPDSKSAVGWDDIAGVDEAAAELQEVVDFLQHPKRFSVLGARVPKGILIYGPPGTGKTLLAKAVAHASGAKFYSQSASAFVEMFAGLGAARIRKLFDKARKNEPAIVFIDELDAVGMRRTRHELQPRARPDSEPAPRRARRLPRARRRRHHRRLEPARGSRPCAPSPRPVRPPDPRRSARPRRPRGDPRACTRAASRLRRTSTSRSIARQTAGLTGADLANICNEAAIFAGRAERGHIRQIDFENAMERVVAGLQQRRVVTEKEKRILAYHEAGHALMSHLVGSPQPVQKVTIVSRGRALGYTLNTPQEDRYLHTKEELLDLMKVLLAGRAAEQIVFGAVTNGAANDLERVTELARAMIFEFGMGDEVSSRTMRADNYALSEHTKRVRDEEQARLTDHAFEEAMRLLDEAPPLARHRRRRAAREGDAHAPRARGASGRRSGGVGRVRARRHAAGPSPRPTQLGTACG